MTLKLFAESLTQNSLFEALHLLEHVYLASESNLGSDELPKNEKVQLKVSHSLGYEHAQFISGTKLESGAVEVMTNLIGLTGEHGVLPTHYTETALNRLKARDESMVDFYDMLNHRLLSLYFRAWRQGEIMAQAQKHSRGERAPLLSTFEALCPYPSPNNDNELTHYYGGLFREPTRSKAILIALIEDLTGCDVSLNEFEGEWVTIPLTEQTRLCSSLSPEGQYAGLGTGAMLGQRAWNVNANCTVELTTMSDKAAAAVIPQTKTNAQLKKLAIEFLGTQKKLAWKLTTKRKHLPTYQLARGKAPLGAGRVLMCGEQAANQDITITI